MHANDSIVSVLDCVVNIHVNPEPDSVIPVSSLISSIKKINEYYDKNYSKWYKQKNYNYVLN